MKPLTAREVERILHQNGFRYVKTEGSHFKWENVSTGAWTVVPHHGNETIRQGTLLAIFRQAGIEPPKR